MKLNYYPDTDSLYIDLANRPSADSREVADGIVLDFDAAGNADLCARREYRHPRHDRGGTQPRPAQLHPAWPRRAARRSRRSFLRALEAADSRVRGVAKIH